MFPFAIETEAAQQQIVLHRHAAKEFTALRYQGHAARNTALHLPAIDFTAEIFHGSVTAARQRQGPHDGVQKSGFSCTVCTDNRDDTSPCHHKVGVADRVDLSIARAEVGHLQDGMLGFVVAAHFNPPPDMAPVGKGGAPVPAVGACSCVSPMTSSSSSMPPR